jgi:hypothetical protein
VHFDISHIDKVMFGAAVARPSWDPHTRQWWDGKIHLPVPMRLECTALHPQAAAPAQVQAAAASPQAQAVAQAEDPSPTLVAADLGEEGEMGIITTMLKDLSLEVAAEMDVDWEVEVG